MMNYEEFKENVIKALEEQTEFKDIQITLAKVNKNNGVVWDGISVRFPNSNIAPMLYINDMFNRFNGDESSIGKMVTNYINELLNAQGEIRNFSTEDIKQENASEHLILRLVNKERNQHLMETGPYMEFNDLIAVPRWTVGDDASFAVTHEIKNGLLHMTNDEVLVAAYKNTIGKEYTLKGMSQVMREMLGDASEIIDEFQLDSSNETMYVLTSADKSFGAAAIMNAELLRKAKEQIGQDFFIIPSSVHEVLLVPVNKVQDPAELREMCMSVNAEVVSDSEILGDNVYYFNGRDLKICNSLEELSERVKQSEGQEAKIKKGVKMG